MKSFVICVLSMGLLMALAPVQGDELNCYKGAQACCKSRNKCDDDCSSSIHDDSGYTQFMALANENLRRSWEYLFISAEFGTHVKQRPGVEKVLHGLANEAWNKGFEMIKEGAKRGIKHDFKSSNTKASGVTYKAGNAAVDFSEMTSLAYAVDVERFLLESANDVHNHHQHAKSGDPKYDAALAHFMEEEIIEKKVDNVRTLVGYVNDLKKFFKEDKDGSRSYPMSLYLFDQYLAK